MSAHDGSSQRRIAHLALRFAVIGVVLGLIGPAFDAFGGITGDTSGSIFIAVGIVVQAAGAAFILAGVIAGIVALARGARPRTLPVLAIAALPFSGLLILIEVFIIFVTTT